MKKWIDRIFVVLGAFLFVQVPIYMQQYQHHLYGHVAELQLQVNKMNDIATSSGNTLDQFIQKFIASPDADFSKQGLLMKETVNRFWQLSKALHALEYATIVSKPFYFLFHIDLNIAQGTLNHFEPGLSFSMESLAYMLCGMIFGYAFFRLLYSINRIGKEKITRWAG